MTDFFSAMAGCEGVYNNRDGKKETEINGFERL